MQAKFLQNLFGVGNQRFEFLVTLIRAREFEHFHFCGLMMTTSGRACPCYTAPASRAEARCLGAKLDGRLVGVKCFVGDSSWSVQLRRSALQATGSAAFEA